MMAGGGHGGSYSQPRVLGVRDMLGHFIQHRKVVVTRRTKFQLRKCLDRANILEGLITAIKNIDRVIKIIRAAARFSCRPGSGALTSWTRGT